MLPSLTVLMLTDAFADLWPELARAAGLDIVLEGAEGAERDWPGAEFVLVAAAGREEAAVERVHRGATRSQRTVVVGTEGDHRLAVRMIRAGAEDYFALPGDLELLKEWLRARVVEETEPSGEKKQRSRYDFSMVVGRSPRMLDTLERVARIIPRDDTMVLLTGETGTGKDLMARCIHRNGPRAEGAFVELNCAALPATLLEAELFGYEKGAFTDARATKPGLLEAADGGTLFLDEIGDLSLELQAKLLRVLETRRVRRLGGLRERRIDVRIVAATHVDLARAVETRRFRRDLFYRLNVASVVLPPLRSRPGDIEVLATHFVRVLAEHHGVPEPDLPPAVREALCAHSWPGNVRELKNGIERAMVFGGRRLAIADLVVAGPDSSTSEVAVPFPASLRTVEASVAHRMVEHCGGNKSDAARLLGISRKFLYNLLRTGREAA